jgi:hypothetical protein
MAVAVDDDDFDFNNEIKAPVFTEVVDESANPNRIVNYNIPLFQSDPIFELT